MIAEMVLSIPEPSRDALVGGGVAAWYALAAVGMRWAFRRWPDEAPEDPLQRRSAAGCWILSPVLVPGIVVWLICYYGLGALGRIVAGPSPNSEEKKV